MAERQLLIKIIGDAKSFVSSLGEAESGTEGLSGKFKGLAVAAAGALSVAAVTGFAKSSVSAFEDVAKATSTLTRLTGDTAENMSRLRFAAEESGISADQLSNGIKKLSKSLQGASDEEQKQIIALNAKNESLDRQREKLLAVAEPTDAQRAKIAELTAAMAENDDKLSDLGVGLDKYGIAMKDANGATRPMNDILLDVAAKFKDMPNGIEKNTLAMKLFGKSGTDLLPFLNRGAEGIAELEKQSDKFGLTIGQKNVDDMKKNVMAHREMHAAVEGLKVQLGEQLMPIITTISVWMAEHLPAAMQRAIEGVHMLTPAFQEIVHILRDDVAPVLSTIATYLETHHAALMALAALIGGAVVVAFTAWAVSAIAAAAATLVAVAPILAVGVALGALVAGIIYAYTHFQTFRDVVDTTIHAVQQIVQDVLGAIEAFWRTWGEAIMVVVTGVFNGIRDYIQGVIDVIRGIIRTVMALIHGDWSGAWDGIKEIVHGVWEMIRGEVEAVMAVIRGLIDAGMTLIAGIFDAAWSGIKTIVSNALDDLVSFMAALPGRILGALGYLGDLLVNSGTELINGLMWGIARTADNIWDWLRAFPGNVLDVLGNLGDILIDVGRALIQGLWNGIEDVWSGLWGRLQDIAGDIAGVFKGVLGIFSPSKVMHGIGTNVMEGLHLGIEGTWPKIESGLNDKAKAIAGIGRFGPSMVGGGVGAAAGGLVINFNAPVTKSDGDWISQQIAASVAQVSAGRSFALTARTTR